MHRPNQYLSKNQAEIRVWKKEEQLFTCFVCGMLRGALGRIGKRL